MMIIKIQISLKKRKKLFRKLILGLENVIMDKDKYINYNKFGNFILE